MVGWSGGRVVGRSGGGVESGWEDNTTRYLGVSRLRLITAIVARFSNEGVVASSYSIRMREGVRMLG